MAEKRDYYDVLGIGKSASQDEIKKAYKGLAKKYHPDINKDEGAEEKFKEVLEAYTILSDPQKKQQYDQHGFEGPQGFGGFDFNEQMRKGGMHFDFSDLFDEMGFGDIFDEGIFGGRRKAYGPRKGQDLRFDMEISFEEAVFGAEKTISFNRIAKCEECRGTGSRDGKKHRCDQCNGRGVVERIQRTPFGMFSTRTACGKCRGQGAIISNPCPECRGNGVTAARRKLKAKIPEGIDNGEHMRLQGEGNAGEKGGETGDLYIVVHVNPHEIFKRDGSDLFAEVPISFAEAALGAEIKVPTMKEEATLKVPAGTQTDTLFKLKGLGVKEMHGKKTGDLYINAVVSTPKKLTKKQKELFEQLLELDGKERKGFFDKLKKGFG